MAANVEDINSDSNESIDTLNDESTATAKKGKSDKKKTKESRPDKSPRLIAKLFGRWKHSVCMSRNGNSIDSLSENYAATENGFNSVCESDALNNKVVNNEQENKSAQSTGQQLLLVESAEVLVSNSDALNHRTGSYPHVSYSRSSTNPAATSISIVSSDFRFNNTCNTSMCFFNGQPFLHDCNIVESCCVDTSSSASCSSRNVHSQIDYMHYLVPDLQEIIKCGYYWGVMDRYEAEQLLSNKPEGTFLLRDSAQEEFLFSVSFRRYGRSLHARIEQLNHLFSFDSHDPDVFASRTVCKLIEHYKDPSSCLFFEPMLLYPLNRTNPFSLQHLCRAMVCSRIAYDDISSLSLPVKLKEYLRYYHYKIKVLVRHFENNKA